MWEGLFITTGFPIFQPITASKNTTFFLFNTVCILFAILLLRSYISAISESPKLHPEIKFAQHFMLCINTQYSLAVISVIKNFFES